MYSRQEVKDFLTSYCDFREPEVVYVLLAVARHKLNEPGESEKRVSKVLYKLDKLDNVLDEIELLMGENNYYLYLSFNSRSIVKASQHLIHKLIDANFVRDYEWMKKTEGMWTSALMQPSSHHFRVFMLDIDTKKDWVIDIVLQNFAVKILRETKNGYHAIIEPCNPDKINQLNLCEYVTVKKDDFIFVNSYIKKENDNG